MGLLDDAIREHLDLKRRRGADPSEVERSERDALGPVRRTPERVPGDDPDLDPVAGAEADAAPGAIYDDGLVGPDEPGEAAFAPDEPDEDEPSWSYDASSDASAPSAAPQEAVALTPPDADSSELDDEADHTAEYDVADALGSQHHSTDAEAPPEGEAPSPAHREVAAPGEEDVLEETPEFLQDTPDHDRLWFEQRPPKDFDFDG